ncbi:ATP-dependent DNA helicase RecG [bacterium]|nr:ATP-dependent DNA helicase RecG [bacterium]
MSYPLDTRLTQLAGVGEVIDRHLRSVGLSTVGDLLQYYPRRYDDYTALRPIDQLKPGLVSVRARVDLVRTRKSFKRSRMSLTEVIVSDGTGTLKLTWFNSPWVVNQLHEGDEYFFLGELKFAGGTFGITQPTFESTSTSKLAGTIVAVYPETQDLNSRLLRDLVAQVIDSADLLEDPLPDKVREQYGLNSLAETVRELHLPKSTVALGQAKHRMAFAELFLHIAASLAIKHQVATEQSFATPFHEGLARDFVGQLDFSLTDDQRKVAWQIFHDLERLHPMNRLLEGDVGSGKTVVAAMAALMVIRAGYQVAIMVPTDILARQHIESFRKLLKPWAVRSELLTSKLPSTRKQDVRARLASGEVHLIIGTQALLTKDTVFAGLGLVIVDEQHRFGVNQRLTLKDKAGRLPHVLTMTATPIPRSLALVVYGDLDISRITELPPGRKPVKTKVVFEDDRGAVYRQVDDLISAGQQVYIVCPAIDESDTGGMKAASEEYKRLEHSVFAHRRIGLVHGKLKADEKAAVMEQFVAGGLDILVATTVIEVGVHVDRANVMLVEQAERFGLATLHQLRGRVGRSGEQAYCYLFTNRKDDITLARVRAIERTIDGFRLAQIDLETRGPGQRTGTRQSGRVELQFARLDDAPLIAEAREAAQAFLNQENIVKYPYTFRQIDRLKTVTSLD